VKIAFVGKGGTGKAPIAALFARPWPAGPGRLAVLRCPPTGPVHRMQLCAFDNHYWLAPLSGNRRWPFPRGDAPLVADGGLFYGLIDNEFHY
jgi:hypothetical protein